MTKQKSAGSDDIDALVARIFALRGDPKARVATDLTKSVAKGPKRARKK